MVGVGVGVGLVANPTSSWWQVIPFPEEKLLQPSGVQGHPLVSFELCKLPSIPFEREENQPCHLGSLEIESAMHLGLQVAVKTLKFINF